jgi:serine/threonine protein kinase
MRSRQVIDSQGSANADGAELASPTLAANARFGAYVVRERIGRGAMGSVYRAVHDLLGKTVALKVLEPVLLGNTEARQRFLREAQVAASIKHPNVIEVTDVGVVGDTPYLVMELLEGTDLQQHLRAHGPLSELELTQLAAPLCAALGAAHDRGIVHRHLEPTNIFLALEANGQVVPKILDFGISKRSSVRTDVDLRSIPLDGMLGSPQYLPPEALLGVHDVTARSDQYALAVILYECLTGHPPFRANGLLDLLNAIARGKFAAPRRVVTRVSPALEGAIVRAMSLDPAQRFADVRDLGRALLHGANRSARPLWAAFRRDGQRGAGPELLAPSARIRLRRRLRVGLGAASAIGLAAIGFYLSRAHSSSAARTPAESAVVRVTSAARGRAKSARARAVPPTSNDESSSPEPSAPEAKPAAK